MQVHAVRFYRSLESLSSSVTRFIVGGVAENQPALIIATPAHRTAILAALGHGIDTIALQQAGGLVCRDAEELLDSFMVGDMPDEDLFLRRVQPALASMSGLEGRVVRAYGEMVDVLCQRGQIEAALRLEDLWNTVARKHGLALLCGYSMDGPYGPRDVERICSRHSHILADSGYAAVLV
jgi:hypothetical protein